MTIDPGDPTDRHHIARGRVLRPRVGAVTHIQLDQRRRVATGSTAILQPCRGALPAPETWTAGSRAGFRGGPAAPGRPAARAPEPTGAIPTSRATVLGDVHLDHFAGTRACETRRPALSSWMATWMGTIDFPDRFIRPTFYDAEATKMTRMLRHRQPWWFPISGAHLARQTRPPASERAAKERHRLRRSAGRGLGIETRALGTEGVFAGTGAA